MRPGTAIWGAFIKRPVQIQAYRWDPAGKNPADSVARLNRDAPDGNRICERCNAHMMNHGVVETLEGTMLACAGDYVIRGVDGEEYPCKPEIFRKTYTLTDGKTVDC